MTLHNWCKFLSRAHGFKNMGQKTFTAVQNMILVHAGIVCVYCTSKHFWMCNNVWETICIRQPSTFTVYVAPASLIFVLFSNKTRRVSETKEKQNLKSKCQWTYWVCLNTNKNFQGQSRIPNQALWISWQKCLDFFLPESKMCSTSTTYYIYYYILSVVNNVSQRKNISRPFWRNLLAIFLATQFCF